MEEHLEISQTPERHTENLHQPVMVDEVLTGLACKTETREMGSGKVYIDCTLGMGGHTAAILKATAPNGKVIGIDRDRLALRMAEKRLASQSKRLTLRQGSFNEIQQILSDLHYEKVDGILFDFGISSYQLDTPERGFSFKNAGPLDMRMDSESGETAADLVNRLSKSELVNLIKTFGEERWAMRIASGILRYRAEKGEIKRTEELENIIWHATPAKFRHGKIHPATRTFQALRIVVNREIEQIESGLATAVSLLGRGGRLVVISFHSLEDRCVKQTFRELEKETKYSKEKRFINLYKKPIVASLKETEVNRRSRSAKLRALERAA